MASTALFWMDAHTRYHKWDTNTLKALNGRVTWNRSGARFKAEGSYFGGGQLRDAEPEDQIPDPASHRCD